MESEIIKLLISVLGAIYFMLPAYVANLSGLAFGGGEPIDGGKDFHDGSRLIGNGVTWKGFRNGTILGTVVGIILGIIGTFFGDLSALTGGIIDLHVYGKPAIIIDKDYVKVWTSTGNYYVIRWDEVVDFKIAPNSKERNVCYPIYKDDSRNSRKFYVPFHHDVFFCDHLLISEQKLLDELKKHITIV